MHNTLDSCLRAKMLSLILSLCPLMHSFLIVLAMFKKLEKFSVQHILEHFVFMEESMCCLYFLLTWLTSDQSKILSLKHAGCIMCLGPVQVMGSMHNLCHKYPY